MIKLLYASHFVSGAFFKTGMRPARLVREYEFELYTTDGGITILNGMECSHSKGSVLIACPGDIRKTVKNFECHALKFTVESDFEFEKYLKQMTGVTRLYRYDSLLDVFNQIYRAGIKTEACPLFFDAKIRELTALLYDFSIKGDSSIYINHTDRVVKCMDFIRKNFNKKISLNDMAAAAGLSPSFLHKIFKQFMEMSPWEYLIVQRMNYAKHLLGDNSISIEKIAEKCGFEERAYFDRVFKKNIGITPAEFRKDVGRINNF